MHWKFHYYLASIILLVLSLPSCDMNSIDATYNDINCICGIEDKIKPNQYIARFKYITPKAHLISISIQSNLYSLQYDSNTDWYWDKSVTGIRDLNNHSENCAIVEFHQQQNTKLVTAFHLLPSVEVRSNREIKFEEFKDKLKKSRSNPDDVVVIDSRLPEVYNAGYVPGAINIPFAELENEKSASKLPENKNSLLIFYCDGKNCKRSPLSAETASKKGYQNIKVYHNGFPDWEKNQQASFVKPAFVINSIKNNEPIVYVDIRNSAEIGHIPGAIAINKNNIEQFRAQFPKNNFFLKMLRIVVYGNGTYDEDQALEVANILNSWGYIKVSVLAGGWAAYKIQGKVVRHELLKQIKVREKSILGKFSSNEFASIVDHLDRKENIFIDVREENEIYRNPGITSLNALKIPLSKLDDQIPKLNKSKTYFIFSNVGKRAFTAWNILNQNGLNCFFVDATVSYSEMTGLTIGTLLISREKIKELKEKSEVDD
jgi:rhodanese-related sulfurtransferase